MWHSCDVTAMFASGVDIDAVMADAVDILGVKAIEYVVEAIPDNDWVNVVMDSFVPIKVSDGLWIVPEWAKTLPEGEEGFRRPRAQGAAFGTPASTPRTRSVPRLAQGQRGGVRSGQARRGLRDRVRGARHRRAAHGGG